MGKFPLLFVKLLTDLRFESKRSRNLILDLVVPVVVVGF